MQVAYDYCTTTMFIFTETPQETAYMCSRIRLTTPQTTHDPNQILRLTWFPLKRAAQPDTRWECRFNMRERYTVFVKAQFYSGDATLAVQFPFVAPCKQCLPGRSTLNVLRPGIVGMRGSIVIRLRRCMIMITPLLRDWGSVDNDQEEML